MDTKNETANPKGLLTLEDRTILRLNGVLHVKYADDTEITLATSLGEFTAEGDDLRIESLSKSSGEILIVGKVNAMRFGAGEPRRARRSLFG